MIRTKDNFSTSEYVLKYKEDAEYVPLSSLYLPIVEEYNNYGVHTVDEVKDLYSKTKVSSIGRFFNHNSVFDSWNSRTLERAKDRLDFNLTDLEKYVDSSTVDLGITANHYERWGTRKQFLEYISGERIDTKHYRLPRTNDYFIVGNLLCIRDMHGNEKNPKLVPVFTMVVKKEYVEYVKLCHILNKQPKGEVFEFWITKDFDTPRTKEKYLRSHVYRKHIKPILLEKNIPIIEKDNWLDDIYKIVKQPVVKTLRDRKEWLNSISSGFTNYLNPKEEVEITPVHDNIASRLGRAFVTGTGSNSDWNMQDVRELFYNPSTSVRDSDNQEYVWPVWENPIIPSESYIAGIDPIDSNREVATWRVNPF